MRESCSDKSAKVVVTAEMLLHVEERCEEADARAKQLEKVASLGDGGSLEARKKLPCNAERYILVDIMSFNVAERPSHLCLELLKGFHL
ncbi:hypothetical protein HPP92_028571 [Vanilla planifolia]|uniref:Uncharacterized protein n=1 Tax=Vanilla planifolia TaxID=51239 RepID=A0A835U3F8_VANPL|nr:hypothetical protein HPP92_028571 [Vanilla planifolia]